MYADDQFGYTAPLNMSTGGHSRHASSRSSASTRSNSSRPVPPPISLTPENDDPRFEPCAATASFLLYAQRNVILVLHHDTLAIERRFELHREDVVWIAVDNTSERGSGRLAVSYDDGNTAIVWDILSGSEIARFSAYERMKVAAFMRNGNIAFGESKRCADGSVVLESTDAQVPGNDQGNIILFEPSTSEHISARTIFDPITAIAPSADCKTFAIGYAFRIFLAALKSFLTGKTQISEWVDSDCYDSTVQAVTHIDNSKTAVQDHGSRMARFFVETKD